MIFDLLGNFTLENKSTVIRIERLTLFIGIDTNLLFPVEVNEKSFGGGFMGRAEETQFGDMGKGFLADWAFLLGADLSDHFLSLALCDRKKILEIA
jgi:hypothetical protein